MCPNCREMKAMLERAISERDQARREAQEAQNRQTSDRLIAGDTLDERKSNMVYILTGRRL